VRFGVVLLELRLTALLAELEEGTLLTGKACCQ
jgi:hypothetical protein